MLVGMFQNNNSVTKTKKHISNTLLSHHVEGVRLSSFFCFFLNDGGAESLWKKD